ncbi:hypothetical protein HOC01_05055 [archaeon]|jgi:hypothetical protein|nr:hypothetical protein [archaeon]MBT6698336.1 hypothetical protein [archaeon]
MRQTPNHFLTIYATPWIVRYKGKSAGKILLTSGDQIQGIENLLSEKQEIDLDNIAIEKIRTSQIGPGGIGGIHNHYYQRRLLITPSAGMAILSSGNNEELFDLPVNLFPYSFADGRQQHTNPLRESGIIGTTFDDTNSFFDKVPKGEHRSYSNPTLVSQRPRFSTKVSDDCFVTREVIEMYKRGVENLFEYSIFGNVAKSRH